MLEAGVPREEMVGGEVEEQREDGPLLLLLLERRPGTAEADGGEMERLLRWWLERSGARRVVVAAVKHSRSDR